MNLAAIIDGHPADAVALVSAGAETTYGELRRDVAGFAGGLQGLGLQSGDRLALLCCNSREFVIAYLGGLSAGLVVVPLNPQSPAPALAAELSTVGARAVIVGPSAQMAFDRVDLASLGALEYVISSHQAVEGAAHRAFEGFARRAFDGLVSAPPTPPISRQADDLAVLLFTSGTAGPPKAAMLTHGNLASNLEQVGSMPGAVSRTADVVLGVLPFFHIFGLNMVLGSALRAGCRVVLMEGFDPAGALAIVAQRGVTILAGPPAMWGAFAALGAVPAESFATVRLAVSGASALPGVVADQVRARYGIEIAQGYGLTETAPTVTTSVGALRAGSIGRAVPGVSVRLVDCDGDDVEPGDAGEIWVHGPNVFAGYWKDPEATAAALTPEGWLRTGDIAIADDDGYLYLIDRIKDLIIVSGFNVSPAEVEDVLRRHPSVAAAAVVGVAHPQAGETVKAFVVVATGRTAEERELIEFCQQHLVRYKCPSSVSFVAQLPEGVVGKIVRRELRGS